MGTRNLTCVVYKGEYKLAKYGQWDGYREGVGANILNFLRNKFNREKFVENVEKLQVASAAQIKQFWVDAGADPNSDFAGCDVAERFKAAHPELSRDPDGGKVLEMIQDGVAKYSRPEVAFAADSLFCEWAYVLDLDKGTFEIYEGFNKTPLDKGERFAFLPQEAPTHRAPEYYPVRLLKSYSLRRLPTVETMCRVPSWSSRAERAKKVNQPVAA